MIWSIFFRINLKDHYNLIIAENGEEGLTKANSLFSVCPILQNFSNQNLGYRRKNISREKANIVLTFLKILNHRLPRKSGVFCIYIPLSSVIFFSVLEIL